MSVRRLLILGAGAAALAAGSAVALAQGAAEPSAEALRAIQTLSSPTVALPLEGSLRVDDTTYQIAGACAAARDAYLAPGAPVPADAVVTPTGSTLTIELPYARSGIMFTDVPSAGHCLYSIEQAPTFAISGTSTALPNADHFARVLCYDDDGLSVLAEVTPPGAGPIVVVLSAEGVVAAPGSFADIAALENAQPLDATAALDGNTDVFTAAATFADGTSAQIDGRCTGSTLELIQTPTG